MESTRMLAVTFCLRFSLVQQKDGKGTMAKNPRTTYTTTSATTERTTAMLAMDSVDKVLLFSVLGPLLAEASTFADKQMA